MPHIVTELPETTANIVRPVVLDVVRDLAAALRLKPETEIIFPGTNQAAIQIGSTLGDEGALPNFGYDGFVRIEIQEQYTEDRALSMATLQQDNRMIFADRDLAVQVRPIYAGTEIAIDFTYEAPNRIVAERFRDDMLVRTAMLRGELLHEPRYYYSMPNAFLIMLKDFHEMREKVAPYGEDFHKWMKDHLTENATNLTTLIGTEMTLVINESQVCVPGHFDFPANAGPIEKAKDGETYSVKFTYTFTFDKVIACGMDYPLVIHNQVISDKYYYRPQASGEQNRPDRRRRSPSWSRNAFDFFTPMYRPTVYQKELQGVRIPEFDDWIPETKLPRTVDVLNVMVGLDLTQPKLILDLDELGDYLLDTDVRTYMAAVHQNLTKYGMAPIHISLYENDIPLDDANVTMDENLVMHSVTDLDPRKRYHVRVAFLKDLGMLSQTALETLRSYGRACKKILIALSHGVVGTAWNTPLLGNPVTTNQIFPRDALNSIIQIICDHSYSHQVGVEYRMLTVGNFLIVAHRDRDLTDPPRRRRANSQPLPGRAGTPRAPGPEGPELPIPATDS